MKRLLPLMLLAFGYEASAQAWKTLPAGVRILGYRNVTTSEVKSNFNQFRSEKSLGTQFKLDAKAVNALMGDALVPGQDVNAEAYDAFTAGEYKLDVAANFNVHGMGFGYGITNKIMFYVEGSYYNATVKARLKRTRGNSYAQTAKIIRNNPNSSMLDETLANNLDTLEDVSEERIQSYIQNQNGYKALGDWNGSGYGDMETGFMVNLVDKSYTGLLLYPGVVLPTGRKDDPDILQDVGFGDGQTDVFLESATGYIANDYLSFGTTLRYTYQMGANQTFRVPTGPGTAITDQKDDYYVKYGNKINLMVNTTLSVNDWLSFTPMYRYLNQGDAQYTADDSKNKSSEKFLSQNSGKQEHQVQFTTTVTSIQPFLKKKFVLPAQVNINLVKTVAGDNVPKVGRFEVELRMLF